MNWTPELLDDIVALSAYLWEEGSDDSRDLVMTQIDDPQELRARHRLRQQKAKARAARKDGAVSGLVPEELAKALVLALTSESLEMAFSYLLMHRWCWKLLGTVKDACDPVLGELYMENETELPWVVRYILMAANGVDGVRDMSLLNVAVEPFFAMIGTRAGQLAINITRKIGKDIQFEGVDGSEHETGCQEPVLSSLPYETNGEANTGIISSVY